MSGFGKIIHVLIQLNRLLSSPHVATMALLQDESLKILIAAMQKYQDATTTSRINQPIKLVIAMS
jgi:hypothetical protein